MSDHVASPIRFVTVGVSDLERARAFYTSVFGWVAHGEHQVQVSDEQLAHWGAPAGASGPQTILGPADERYGLLRLVAVEPSGQRIRNYRRVEDEGHYALNVRAADIGETWERMLASGAEPKSEPTYWVVNSEIAATDSQCFDPDGMLLDVFEVHGDALGPVEGRASNLQTMAIRVDDAERSAAYYGDLGFEVLYDRRIDDLGEFFHLPAGVAMRNINLHMPAVHANGRIEIAGLEGASGTPVTDRAGPPNIGMWSITFETADIARSLEITHRHGGATRHEPRTLDVPGLGSGLLAYAHGPDGEAVEFFQPASD